MPSYQTRTYSLLSLIDLIDLICIGFLSCVDCLWITSVITEECINTKTHLCNIQIFTKTHLCNIQIFTKTHLCNIQIFKSCKNRKFSVDFFLYFSYFCSKQRLWVHVRNASLNVRNASLRRFLRVPTIYVLEQKTRKIGMCISL